jgi:hypothetical protein
MKVLVDRTGAGVDQPYVSTLTVNGKDHLYVGDNDFSAPADRTATIEQSLNAAKATPSFTTVRIEKRANAGQDGPPIRPCPHPDGTVYAVFHSWRTSTTTRGAAPPMSVVRDDKAAAARRLHRAVDPGDSKTGVRVATASSSTSTASGLQRTGGDVSIAVDPTDSEGLRRLQRRSRRRLRAAPVALNRSRRHVVGRSADNQQGAQPALAVNALAASGCSISNSSAAGGAAMGRQVRVVDRRQDVHEIVLATTPATNPPKDLTRTR